MNLNQTAKNNMYKAVLTFLSNNAKAFGGFKRLATAITTFIAKNQTLDGYISQQAGTSTGSTGTKSTLFTAMCALVVKAARKALVYAVDQDDETMQALFNVQLHDFETTGTAALAKIENIYAGLRPLSGLLDDYRVTADDIMAIGSAVTAYEAAAGTPQNAKAAAEAGTKGITATIPLIDKTLDVMDDLIIHGMDDEPELVNIYRKVRRIVVLGTHHTGLMATVNDAAGNGIEGAAMLVQELKKKAMSDILGVADIESMLPGMYHVIFSADGYASQTQILKIEQGKTLTEEVVMVKEVK